MLQCIIAYDDCDNLFGSPILLCLQVYEWLDGAAQPSLLFSCDIGNLTEDLKSNRNMFATARTASAQQQLQSIYKLMLQVK